MNPTTTPPASSATVASWKASRFDPLWLDTDQRPQPRESLQADTSTDLLVVGGGFAGLWTALRAAERKPGRRILLVEADRLAEHATGRNGGFCEASLTHGEENGKQRWPDEYETLHRLGLENLDGIEQTVQKYGIECGFARGGVLNVATREHEIEYFKPGSEGFLDAEAVRSMVDSPTYLAGGYDPIGCAVLDPARLAWGLADACESLGVQIAEHSRLESVAEEGDGVVAVISTPEGHRKVTAQKLAIATNAFPNPLGKSLRHLRARYDTVPVFDYVLATEPLTEEQLAEMGWDPSIGVADAGNQFHYYRVTPDRRILWGGYDVIYHFGRAVKPGHYDRAETFQKLAEHFAETFPQLEGIRFTHRWSGVIDTSTQFCAMFGRAYGDRVVYATGFTGLGVAATRFAADTMLDLLAGEDTERTGLEMVRKKPLPFPPEPIAWVGIKLTTWARAREDATGKRNLWLKTMDKLGLGFDS
ncbi:FAD-dependent oxidoreductase [Nesterenkonia sp. MY13]|uniref:FAD-dependent oxidoreductase n=1 Tax=Nesterenkonia sedimenti TaxID=1463632 RepID=A0A7X8TII0_9MICC|nr:FAD-dependent oxidoreductase [Nesterenkonia sedimenti]NLS09387.1 FAD-dependent oxidoreductase [Nesterenkonia sedimenti]